MIKKAKLVSLVFSAFPSKLLHIIFLITFLYLSLPLPDVHPGQVTLAWDANTSPGIAGYKVYYGSASGSHSYVIDVGNVTSYTVPNLQDGTTYYFASTVYDTSGQESGYSNQVSNSAPATCTFTISPTSTSSEASGGTGTVSLTTQSGCAWTAVSNASWILITSNGSGAGSATVNYSVSPKGTPSTSRSGTMTIAGQTLNITQGKLKRYFSTESRTAGK